MQLVFYSAAETGMKGIKQATPVWPQAQTCPPQRQQGGRPTRLLPDGPDPDLTVGELPPGRSARFCSALAVVQQPDVGEGEVAVLPVALALPLAVHVDLHHLHHVPHLEETEPNQPVGPEPGTTLPNRPDSFTHYVIRLSFNCTWCKTNNLQATFQWEIWACFKWIVSHYWWNSFSSISRLFY